jgi:glutaconate CoA-transferase subunit B
MAAEDMVCTVEELMCACIARQVQDGDVLAQGLATPIVAAGYLLARRTHAPNCYFSSAIGQSVCKDGAPLGVEQVEALWLDKALATFGFISGAADLLPRVQPKEFFRPGQVDPEGNFNNIAIGSSYTRPRLRLPGAGGIPDVTVYLPKVYLYVPRHSRVTFVPHVDHVSGLGHNRSGRRGSGPTYLVSDLGQFDFFGGRIRLTHLHPGISERRVRAKTGFDLQISDDLRVTELPSTHELALLRNEIDPLGVRELEALSGPERRRALARIIAMERRRGMVPDFQRESG